MDGINPALGAFIEAATASDPNNAQPLQQNQVGEVIMPALQRVRAFTARLLEMENNKGKISDG
jgi:hypothetical protein